MSSTQKVKTVEVDKVKYTMQKLPVRDGLELRKRSIVDGGLDDIAFYEELLEHVVIKPKQDLDDFEDIGHLEKVMLEVIEYQFQGK